jgi:hypothetical protein
VAVGGGAVAHDVAAVVLGRHPRHDHRAPRLGRPA